MKKLRTSIWLPALMTIYATAFFAYKFFVENVGASVRNVSVAAITYMLVAAVWFVNRRKETKRNGAAHRER